MMNGHALPAVPPSAPMKETQRPPRPATQARAEALGNLTPVQLAALAWLRDNPHFRARWMVGREEPAGQPRTAWTHIEIGGEASGIRLSIADWRQIAGFLAPCHRTNFLYRLTAEGVAILAALPKRFGFPPLGVPQW
jgi:hypothetical protein